MRFCAATKCHHMGTFVDRNYWWWLEDIWGFRPFAATGLQLLRRSIVPELRVFRSCGRPHGELVPSIDCLERATFSWARRKLRASCVNFTLKRMFERKPDYAGLAAGEQAAMVRMQNFVMVFADERSGRRARKTFRATDLSDAFLQVRNAASEGTVERWKGNTCISILGPDD